MDFIKNLTNKENDSGVRMNMSIWGSKYDPQDPESVDAYRQIMKDKPMTLANFGFTLEFVNPYLGVLTSVEYLTEHAEQYMAKVITFVGGTNRTEAIDKKLKAYQEGSFRNDLEVVFKEACSTMGIDDLKFFLIIITDLEERVFIHAKAYLKKVELSYDSSPLEFIKELP